MLMEIMSLEVLNLEVIESLINEVIIQVATWEFVLHVFVEIHYYNVISALCNKILSFFIWLDESWSLDVIEVGLTFNTDIFGKFT